MPLELIPPLVLLVFFIVVNLILGKPPDPPSKNLPCA